MNALARSAAYAALAAIFRRSPPSQSPAGTDPAGDLLEALEAIDEGLARAWQATCDKWRVTGGEDQVRVDTSPVTHHLSPAIALTYNRLFVGPMPPLAHPYESVYRTPGGRLMGEVTVQITEAYAGAGLALADDNRDLPDHVTVELEFMAYLASEEAAAREEGDETLAADRRARQIAFLRDHLTLWIPNFCHRVIEADRDGYYGRAAVTLAAFVVNDLDSLTAYGLSPIAYRLSPPDEAESAIRHAKRPSAIRDKPWDVSLRPERSFIPCTLCGICAEVCRPAALRLVEVEVEGAVALMFDAARCDGCGYCVKYCPERILRVEPVSNGATQALGTRQLAASAVARCAQCGKQLRVPLPMSEVALSRILERFRRMKGDPKDEAAMRLCHECKVKVKW